MPIIRAEFTNWELADQAIASLKKEAIPLHQIRISEHQSFASSYTATQTTAEMSAAALSDHLSVPAVSEEPILSFSSHNPILVELQVESGDQRRVESILHRIQPTQSVLPPDPYEPWH